MSRNRKQRPLRVRTFTSRTDYSGYQLLQEKRWWGWKTIDREDVPASVNIDLATFGDAGGWISKFHALGTFGRDGVVQPRAAAS